MTMQETCKELVQNLKEYAEWARANEYEVHSKQLSEYTDEISGN